MFGRDFGYPRDPLIRYPRPQKPPEEQLPDRPPPLKISQHLHPDQEDA
jgi:hypothetical protein